MTIQLIIFANDQKTIVIKYTLLWGFPKHRPRGRINEHMKGNDGRTDKNVRLVLNKTRLSKSRFVLHGAVAGQ